MNSEYEDIKFMSKKIGGPDKLNIHPKLANPFLSPNKGERSDSYRINQK